MSWWNCSEKEEGGGKGERSTVLRVRAFFSREHRSGGQACTCASVVFDRDNSLSRQNLRSTFVFPTMHYSSTWNIFSHPFHIDAPLAIHFTKTIPLQILPQKLSTTNVNKTFVYLININCLLSLKYFCTSFLT